MIAMDVRNMLWFTPGKVIRNTRNFFFGIRNIYHWNPESGPVLESRIHSPKEFRIHYISVHFMIYLICCTNFRMVYISIVCKTSRPTDCLRPQSHRSRRLQPAVIRLFLLVRAPETYCASRTFTSAESAAHLSLDNRISLSHNFFQFWCSQCKGLFIPAARQIYEWSFALGA